MQAQRTKKALTFGDLIANLYSACGKRRAEGLLRLATKAHLVALRGRSRYVSGRGNGKT